jgi:hypothetical protein
MNAFALVLNSLWQAAAIAGVMGGLAIDAGGECSDTVHHMVGRIAARAVTAIRDREDSTPYHHAGQTCGVRIGRCRESPAT